VRPPLLLADATRALPTEGADDAALSLVERVRRLQARCVIPVTDTAHAWYVGLLSDAEAVKRGERGEGRALVDRWLAAVTTLAVSILAQKITGYGPMRLAYACELALDVAQHDGSVSAHKVDKAGSSARATSDRRAVARLRRKIKRALGSLAGKRRDRSARTRAAVAGSQSHSTRIASLEALAQALEALLREVPPEVAADAGATPSLVAEARRACARATEARDDHGARRALVASTYDTMHIVKGRLDYELSEMLSAANDARDTDATVPSTSRARSHKAKGAKPPEPPK
jgi:hypothetical protein